MSKPPIIELPCGQPTRVVFIGNLQWWAKLRPPPDTGVESDEEGEGVHGAAKPWDLGANHKNWCLAA